MKVNIKYFASLREAVGKDQEQWKMRGTTVQDLFNEIKNEYNFSIEQKNLKVAINEDYSEFSQPLRYDDTVVFIPPVAGG